MCSSPLLQFSITEEGQDSDGCEYQKSTILVTIRYTGAV